MDNYTEQILEAKATLKSRLALVVSYCILAVGVVIMAVVNFIVGVLLIIVGGLLIAFTKNLQSIEYEYLFTNGDCDIACIINKSSRRNEMSFVEGDVFRVVKYSLDKCKNELEIDKKLSIMDFTSGDESNSDNWYVFFVTGKKGTNAVVLELNDKSLDNVKQNYKSKLELK